MAWERRLALDRNIVLGRQRRYCEMIFALIGFSLFAVVSAYDLESPGLEASGAGWKWTMLIAVFSAYMEPDKGRIWIFSDSVPVTLSSWTQLGHAVTSSLRRLKCDISLLRKKI